jgi:hypothetical protein
MRFLIYILRDVIVRVGLTDIFKCPSLAQHLKFIFKFEVGLYKFSLKTEHLFRCQHIFGAIYIFLHSISAM